MFARKVPEALDYGLENLERAFHGCPDDVVRSMHMCCGYPDALDSPDYPKAPKEAYFQLAEAVDRSSVMAISLEDAHRRNDLALLERFASTTVILGVIAIAKSRVESIDEVRTHLAEALEHIDAKRLIAAPDCGLGARAPESPPPGPPPKSSFLSAILRGYSQPTLRRGCDGPSETRCRPLATANGSRR